MKIRDYIFPVLMLLVTVWLYSCAKTGRINGGPKDTTPPRLIPEKSTPNYMVNFKEEKIVLTFDEFVNLKQLRENILISPPMTNAPDINQRGKKVIVRINKDEELRKNATYSIDFGNAIVDYNEGNALEGYKYIFATGDKIDSLTLSGKVINAYNEAEPVGEIYLLLYDILEDSIVAKERPFYVVKTEEDGSYQLENLRSDTFMIIALDDKNFNLIYDLDSEGFGYYDDTLFLSDSTKIEPILKLFSQEKNIELVSKNTRTYGLVEHVMSMEADSTLSLDFYYPENYQLIDDRDGDTVKLWYTEYVDSFMYSLGTDTVTIYPGERDTIFDQKSLQVRVDDKYMAPWDDVRFITSAPIREIDTAFFSLYETIVPPSGSKLKGQNDSTLVSNDTIVDSFDILDSTLVRIDTASSDTSLVMMDSLIIDDALVLDTARLYSDSLVLDSVSLDSLSLDSLVTIDTMFQFFSVNTGLRDFMTSASWKPKQSYTLYLLPGAITDLYGRTNDTLNINFTIKDSLDFGNISISIDDLHDSLDYVLILMSDDEVIKKHRVISLPQDSVTWQQMPTGDYTLQLIEDLDSNGRWTTGDFWSRRQPENIRREKLQSLKGGWDLEGNISWNVPQVVETPADSTEITNPPTDSLNIKSPPPNIDKKKAGKTNKRGIR